MGAQDQMPRGEGDLVNRVGALEKLYQVIVGLAGSASALAQAIQVGLGNLATSGTTWAGPVASPSTVNAGTSMSVGTNITASGGTLVSTYARSHSVATSYVAAYIDGSGNFLSTPSSLRMKRDIRTATWTREQRDKIRAVFYRLRAAYILADMQGEDLSKVETLPGVIGEELLAAGLPEFVVLDEKGRVFTVRYELLALIAIDGLQQVEVQMDELRAEVAALRAAIKP